MIRSLLLWLLRKTRPPYEAYWRDRAFRADRLLREMRSHPSKLTGAPFWAENEIDKVLEKAK